MLTVKPATNIRYLLLLLSNIALWFIALYRTIIEYPTLFNDFRNRVVGARLMKDGLEPYFYIWKQGDPLRYYDTGVDPHAFLSVSTATPFAHWLMYPICDLPQYQLNLIWFVVQWASAAICVFVAVSFCGTTMRKQLVGLAGALMMLTLGTRQHFFQMQQYLPIPALIMAALYCWQKKKGWAANIFSAICIAAVILIRPTFLLLFVPLAFYQPLRTVMLCTMIALAGYGMFAITNKTQRYNWQQFYLSIQYRNGNLPTPPYTPVSFNPMPYQHVEGMDVAYSKSTTHFDRIFSDKNENANFHFIYQGLTGKMPSATALYLLQLLVLLAAAAIVFLIVRTKAAHYWYQLLVTGFCLYWMIEFFSPVASKLLYYFVLLLYPVLLYFALQTRLKWLPTILIAAGILLNLNRIDIIKMNCTLGQGFIMLGLVVDVWMRVRDGGSRRGGLNEEA